MPKMKTNRSAAKRFRATGSGKIRKNSAYMRHILTKKSPKRKRQLGKSSVAHPSNVAQLKRMLPYL